MNWSERTKHCAIESREGDNYSEGSSVLVVGRWL